MVITDYTYLQSQMVFTLQPWLTIAYGKSHKFDLITQSCSRM